MAHRDNFINLGNIMKRFRYQFWFVFHDVIWPKYKPIRARVRAPQSSPNTHTRALRTVTEVLRTKLHKPRAPPANLDDRPRLREIDWPRCITTVQPPRRCFDSHTVTCDTGNIVCVLLSHFAQKGHIERSCDHATVTIKSIMPRKKLRRGNLIT